jgi:uncharacterized membrane protein YfcA
MRLVAGVIIGLIAGIASGVAGVGGGVIMVPAMTAFLAVPQHLAQGTSLVAILFTSVSATVVNLRNGRVNLKMAAVIGVTGAVAAQVGSRLALATDQGVLQRVFGILVLYSALRMLWNVWKERGATTSGA